MAFFNDAIVQPFDYRFLDPQGRTQGVDANGRPYLADCPVTCDRRAYLSDVKKYVHQLPRRVEESDVLIVYMRSHGSRSTNNYGGFVALNGRKCSDREFLRLIRRVGAKTVFLICEACKSCGIQNLALQKFRTRNFVLLCSSSDNTYRGSHQSISLPRQPGNVRVKVSRRLLPALLARLDGRDADLGTIARDTAAAVPQAKCVTTPNSLFPRKAAMFRTACVSGRRLVRSIDTICHP